MAVYRTPGVYIEELSTFPPSIAAVETAIPAFIGYTEKADYNGENDLINIPKRITSLLEYEQYFGKAAIQVFNVTVKQTETETETESRIIGPQISFSDSVPSIPEYCLYYSMQMFFANGGGPCYIVSVTTYPENLPEKDAVTPLVNGAIDVLEKYDEPTLYVFPDARLGTFSTIIDHALKSCSKMQDRFTIIDVCCDKENGNQPITSINNFRKKIPNELAKTKYGAAYFPYLETSINFNTNDENIIVTEEYVCADGKTISANTSISSIINNVTKPEPEPTNKGNHTAIYNAIKEFIRINGTVTLPPSGAVAGVYARVDASRGVWKAPANQSLSLVKAPAINITNDTNDNIYFDPESGKSVNVIRSFTGKGTLIWGTRTLAGNDNEWRYISVRRFFNFVEESVKKATSQFVFEPNDANTWVKVRTMIENFLTFQWRDGALAGAKPDDAFYVNVGLNQTMSAQDILNGYMIIEIGMAVVRPAEFIVLRFSHKMQES